MRKRDAGFAVTRVLLVLDVGCHDARTVAAAAEIAARLDVRLAGLFIEDIDLFRVAALPAARHLELYGETAAAIDAAHLESELEGIAARAEGALAMASRRHRLRCSFGTARGALDAELAAATIATDLIVVGSAPPLPGLEAPIRSPFGRAARRTRRPVLLLPPRPTLRRPAAVIAAASTHARRTLAAAARLSIGTEAALDVLIAPADAASAPALEAWTAARLARRAVEPRFLRAEAPDVEGIARAAETADVDILVLSADLAPGNEDIDLLPGRTGRPVLAMSQGQRKKSG